VEIDPTVEARLKVAFWRGPSVGFWRDPDGDANLQGGGKGWLIVGSLTR